MRSVASLGMYDHPAQHVANDALWAFLARRLRDEGLIDVPDRLDRSRSVEAIWHDPRLLLAQACGYPLTAADAPAVRIVALPVYDAPGCEGPTHRSVIVAAADDTRATLAACRGGRAAINGWSSNSGMNLLRAAVAPLAVDGAFFADVIVTGAHRASALAVAEGNADVAAIDCVTWAALDTYEPALTRQLRVIGETGATVALPFVTATTTGDTQVAALRRALSATVIEPTLAGHRAALMLRSIVMADGAALAPVRAAERAAVRLGYPILG